VRLKAESMLEGAMGKQMGMMKDIGKPLVPTEILPRAWIKNPDQCCRSWRSYTKHLALRHFARHYPPWVLRVADDAGDSIDMMFKLDSPNTHFLPGWGFGLRQLMRTCQINGNTV
jgi:hypothetical protein